MQSSNCDFIPEYMPKGDKIFLCKRCLKPMFPKAILHRQNMEATKPHTLDWINRENVI